MSDTAIPVGTIVAYAAEPTKWLPSQWEVCQGQTKNKDTYKDLWDMIGYANGGGGSSFNLPNLQGRFLRGANNNNAGSKSEWKTALDPNTANQIRVSVDRMATHNNYGPKSLSGKEMIQWNGERKFEVTQDSYDDQGNPWVVESRPINTYMHYIIKVKKDDDSLPIGSVFPFAGPKDKAPISPNYIRCGVLSNVSQVDGKVSQLQKIVGTAFDPRHEPDIGKDVFYAPDLSGKFVRGVDPTHQVDPQGGKRKQSPGGNEQGIGTWQEYDTAFKNPFVKIQHFSTSSTKVPECWSGGHENIEDHSYFDHFQWSGGSAETRPRNVAVDFYISSSIPEAGKLETIFPVGGIIAIPGSQGAPSEDRWLPCDGTPLFNFAFDELHKVIGNSWGSSGNKFCLPDLRNNFLRGAHDGIENGDPDHDNREELQPGGAKKGVGSFQNYATGFPTTHNLFVRDENKNTPTYPTGVIQNPRILKSDVVNNLATWDGSAGNSFRLEWDFDDETAPACIAVNFYICYTAKTKAPEARQRTSRL